MAMENKENHSVTLTPTNSQIIQSKFTCINKEQFSV